jgi:hypothetical protein
VGDGVTEPSDDGTGEPGWRPSRGAKISALVLAILLVLGITGFVIATNHNTDAPLAAVREYVDAIARGDAATANRLVDPKGFADGVDPKLLTNEVLRSATARIEVEEVRLGFDADLSADVVDVQVEYKLADRFGATVLLRAKRAGTTAGFLHEWRVIDPLLVPIEVETNEPRLDTASLGAATVPVGGPSTEDWPQRRFYVYPGVYDLRGHESRYLEAPPDVLVASSDGYDERPADSADQTIRGLLPYRATQDLTDAIEDKLGPYLTACARAGRRMSAECPDQMRVYADFATDLRVERVPLIESIGAYQVEYPDEREKPPLRMRSSLGRFSFTENGERGDDEFYAYAHIVVTPADDLTITFTGQL